MPRLRSLAVPTALAALLVVPALPCPASAFCGFYVSGAEGALFNNATQVVLMREGTRTILSMQNNYDGPPEDFALVIPVPVVLDEDEVQTLDNAVFADIDRMASPRLVEYWEQDPCNPHDYLNALPGTVETVSTSDSSWWGDDSDDTTVVVEAQFKVGEYEIVILSASESTGLDRWLRRSGYNIPAGADRVLAPYIAQGMYFFVAKVDVTQVTKVEGRVTLSPLRFHYESERFELPIRLGLLNARDKQDLIVHILARSGRYQVVNRPNVAIPTNLHVKDAVRQRFAEFYAALLDWTLARTPGAVVTEYAWDASSCDPCPGPTLTPEHFLTLGADVLPGKPQWGYTLTRLHARYGRDDIGEDLVFGAASPITGGREVFVDTNELEQGAQTASFNNFQGRYIIRHPWTGPIECDTPQRGIWGGPPDSGRSSAEVTPALHVAFAPRGNADLNALLDAPDEDARARGVALAEVQNTEPLTPPPLPEGASGDVGCASCAVATTNNLPLLALLGAAMAFGALVVRRLR